MNRMNYGGLGVAPMPHPSVPLGYSSSIGSYGNPMTNTSPMGYSTPIAPLPGPSLNSAGLVAPVNTAPVMAPAQVAAGTKSAAKPTDGSGMDTNKTGFFGPDGFNLGDMKGLVDIIGGFGSLWSGMQMNKLAKETLTFNKDTYDRNLTNSIASYNLALEDRMRSRYNQTNGTTADADAAIERHRLRK